ncbi:nucleotide disphospho-sugar-binding domain-containing protein [Streptomyces daqingensis]|uniref:nucleotide disphospho-sugar-binding domain-containing protein n=1 Tax=Streptomyces daqingensis TaxID=1472640 RepID=UPI003570CCB4
MSGVAAQFAALRTAAGAPPVHRAAVARRRPRPVALARPGRLRRPADRRLAPPRRTSAPLRAARASSTRVNRPSTSASAASARRREPPGAWWTRPAPSVGARSSLAGGPGSRTGRREGLPVRRRGEQQALFTRVAAVVHHGGAGTTTAAARAGAPQVVLPQLYDQPHWADAYRTSGAEPRSDPGRKRTVRPPDRRPVS